MTILLNFLILLSLFLILGLAGDLAVNSIKYIASAFKMRLFAFGILLGLITNIPELLIGINATIDNAADISVGNLNGGVLVLLGLILGASLIFGKKIDTDGDLKRVIPAVLVIFMPIILGWNGKYSLVEGVIMMATYFVLVVYLYLMEKRSKSFAKLLVVKENKILKSIFFFIFGLAIMLLASNWIIDFTLELLKGKNISNFAIGLLVFSIGTNLPEITIAITSFRKKTLELSFSNLLSSAFTRVLVLGFLAVLQPITFATGQVYFVLSLFLAILLISFVFFYKSHKKLDRREGAFLFLIYVSFLITNFFIIK